MWWLRLLSLGPWGWGGLWVGWKDGATWLGPAGTVGQDLPCIIPSTLAALPEVWGVPVLTWVPSANPGHASEQVLGEGCPQQGALGLQHGLRGALDGETHASHPWFLTEQLCIAISFFLSFFLFAWAQRLQHTGA